MKKRTARILHAVPWKRVALYAGIALPALLIVAQLFYPWGNTAPGAHVEGVAVGGLPKDEASQRIVAAYQATPVPVQFGDASKPYRSPTVKELGATVNADAAAASALYPWWLRLVPTSVWWAHAVVGSGVGEVTQHKEAVQSYVTRELGESCSVAPKNASVTVKDDALVVVPAEDGGSCKVDDVVAKLVASTPRPASDNTVRVAMKKIAPAIGDEQAKQLIATLEAQLSAQPAVLVGEERVALDASAVRSWLVFNEEEGVLTATIDASRADESLTALLAKKVAKPAGVVTITTKDFTEISRTGGGDGAALNIEATAQNLTKFLRKEAEDISVAITKIEPQKKYIRSYSATDTGLSALMQNFAESNKGVFGVSLIELSGQRRQAGYNETKSFFPASTYKVYVAYSVLRKVEAGQLRWEDQITGGRSLAKCFDDMIVLSDNPCAEALTLKIGTPTLNSDLAALGLSGSRFVGPGTHTTTARDLSVFMASLESGQLSINGDSRNRLLSALKRNVYRRGIPAGASGAVANKVGFIDALLHDTAVVYSPSGTYVLTIMSDGSSWGVIAELTKQIETLRNQ